MEEANKNDTSEKNEIENNIKDNKGYQENNNYLNEILYFSINQESK